MLKGGYAKILDASYDPKEMVSQVTKAGKHGTFTAYTRVHPDDIDVANEWDGLLLSEYKVDVMVQQRKAEMFKDRAFGARMVLDYLDMGNVPADDPVYQRVARCVSNMARNARIEDRIYRDARDNFPKFVDMLHEDRREFEKRVARHMAEQQQE